MRFKLLAGRHTEVKDGKVYKYVPRGRDGNLMLAPNEERDLRKEGVVLAGDVVESRLDLCEKFNAPPGPPKFEHIPDAPLHGSDPAAVAEAAHRGFHGDQSTAAASAVVEDNLDSLTVAALRELAAGEEIDLQGETRKDRIIAIIRAAR